MSIHYCRFIALLMTVLVSVRVANAEMDCAPYIDHRPEWRSAQFRAHSDAFTVCPVEEAAYRRVLREWLLANDGAHLELKSIGLGRAVDYPWISEYLVQAARDSVRWDARSGRALTRGDNAFVASLLSSPEFIERLQAPFAGSGYSVESVSVEKVLVGDYPDQGASHHQRLLKLPFDAQVWLTLKKRPEWNRKKLNTDDSE